ncbi:hypothetical protein H9I45_15085 [Polaribacter haliotis]|uniref:Uncharacterized protein n=1 Tax=Polaribacter haliotis TaxID=1888915 RepID=A0A7L8AF47_9FLAO|nr:hypothetical protein [Polaribacter haliotis]QOD60638.1 hypothetical protein H9I45_15060 [Polaribacter haliotis]QOD60642.1 hypothetical protein H9I45_15080 [Polaribacter haliotis]QOD60643.1 hypothetical protein H9I45_15085 [Polaribacter haliotis]
MTDLEKKLLNRVKELEDKEAISDQAINGCLPLGLILIGIVALLIFG